MRETRLAGVLYGEGEGPRMDDMLVEVVTRLRSGAKRLAGAIQHNTDGGDRCRCDMTLEDLASGRLIDISEKRGPQSSGCRLDSFALEESVGVVVESLNSQPDLLIINRFGKREGEGHGFRQAIERALELNIPVLAAVGAGQKEAWQNFTGSFADQLPVDADAIMAWCTGAVDENAGANTTQKVSSEA